MPITVYETHNKIHILKNSEHIATLKSNKTVAHECRYKSKNRQ